MRSRTEYDDKTRKEIAHAFYNGNLSVKDVERKGIKIGNVYRWMREYFGPGGRFGQSGRKGKRKHKSPAAPESATAISPAPTPTPAAETVAPESSPPALAAAESNSESPLDINTLSKKDCKRSSSGRYDPRVKEACMRALEHMSVSEVKQKTGIHITTLYQWRNEINKSNDTGRATAVVPITPKPMSKPELVLNQGAVDSHLINIRKAEGFTNIDKAIKELKAAYRNGLIEDYDPIDLRILLGYSQLIGAPLRARK